MKHFKKLVTLIISGIAMTTMILDTEATLSGAAEGVELCVRTIIPSLFPFFVLTSLLTGSLSGFSFFFLRPLGKLCRLPEGSEPLLILGLLGGYPTGARNIAQQYSARTLTKKDARRLLGFCSNAGPAFIFGIAASQFQDRRIGWYLWGIHVLAAILTGILLSGKSNSIGSVKNGSSTSLPLSVQIALRNTASVCGWVIIFRVLIGFITTWFGEFISPAVLTAVSGLLELSVGCCALDGFENTGLRFVLCSVMLGFGGLCVLMQTISVTDNLGLGAYIPGRLLHAALSFQLSYQLQYRLFPHEERLVLPGWIVLSVWLTLFLVKITVAIGRIMVYNSDNSNTRGPAYAVSQKNRQSLPLLRQRSPL